MKKIIRYAMVVFCVDALLFLTYKATALMWWYTRSYHYYIADSDIGWGITGLLVWFIAAIFGVIYAIKWAWEVK